MASQFVQLPLKSVPRLSQTAIDALQPVLGQLVYNLDTDKLQVYAAGAWVDLN